jgi:hypothetical protein
MRFLGLDVHRDFCEVAIAEDGMTRPAGQIKTSLAELGLFAQSLAPSDVVAIEATANALAIARIIEPHALTRAAQFKFVAGHSEPPGPGRNSVGLAIFRYQTRCGTVYGHTGNTAGYTQFIAASSNGARSAVVSISAQINPSVDRARFKELQDLYTLAVCAALA